MQIESLDLITVPDFHSFDSLMAEYQRYEDRLKTNKSHTFPEAVLLQRFGSPGPHITWYRAYQWMKYMKEVELGASKETDTYQMVANQKISQK